MEEVRLAELLGTFSMATDVGQGMPDEAAIRMAVLAVGLAESAGVDEETAGRAYWLSVLLHAGCTADAKAAAEVMGDKPAVQRDMYGIDYANPVEFFPFFLKRIGREKPLPQRIVQIFTSFAALPKLMGTAKSTCEVGDKLAACFGFEQATREALFQVFERWNGKGMTEGLKGEAIALSTRIGCVAHEAEIGHRLGGEEGAVALVRKRAGGMLDPTLAECFAKHAASICAPLQQPDVWATFLDAEPMAQRLVQAPAVDEALLAFADFTDLLSPWFHGHSSGVAALAGEAASRFGLEDTQVRLVRCAGLVHDIGRVGIPVTIWHAPRPLTTGEMERVRSHTYLTERILGRSAALAPIAELASLAHERLEGDGYHRRLPRSALTPASRVLAASDCYRAMCEDRPHRPRLDASRAAKELRAMAASGALDADAVEAVVGAAGHEPRLRRPRPGGLSKREQEVVCLLARGLTNKEIATSLDISTKTAGHHVQNIFEKMGVTTRAAATFTAMQRGLL